MYHAGVYSCLLRHNLLLSPRERLSVDDATKAPILTGVSAGALISAAISAGVTPEDAMGVVLKVAERTKEKGGIMDVLKPGFSLIDQLEDLMELEMQSALGGSKDSKGDYDNELLMNRIQGGNLLHIGLTDRNKFDVTNPRADLKAYAYVDQYRDLKDISAAALLSSYIPVGTGPANWEKDSKNLAVRRAWGVVKEMRVLGFIKDGITKSALLGYKKVGNGHLDVVEESMQDSFQSEVNDDKLGYLDGGLANMFPEIDDSTLIVSPINGIYKTPFIAPMAPTIEGQLSMEQIQLPFHFEMSDRVKIGANVKNLLAFYQMARSSSPQVLEEKFGEGYNDAKRFLNEHGLASVFSVHISY